LGSKSVSWAPSKKPDDVSRFTLDFAEGAYHDVVGVSSNDDGAQPSSSYRYKMNQDFYRYDQLPPMPKQQRVALKFGKRRLFKSEKSPVRPPSPPLHHLFSPRDRSGLACA
jgi:hypothetical protein